MKQDQLDELDQKILKLIGENARIPFLEVARECNVSGAAIHQRITKLTECGIIKGSKFILDIAKIGYESSAFIGVCVPKTICLQTLISKLREIPEIIECHYSSGRHDLMFKLVANNNKDMLAILQNKIYPLGFTNIETMVMFEEVFVRQIPV